MYLSSLLDWGLKPEKRRPCLLNINLVKCFPFLPCPVFSDEWSSWPRAGTSDPVVWRPLACTGVWHSRNRRARDSQAGSSFFFYFFFFKWMSVTMGDEFSLMPVMVEGFWITWEDTVAEGELKDDSLCGLCCLGRWVPVATAGTPVLTCLSVLIKKGLKHEVMRGTTAPTTLLQMQQRNWGQQLLRFLSPCTAFPLPF